MFMLVPNKRKAVALISGGLDSMLAAKLILDQGVHVEGLNFYTGFCHSGHTSAIRNTVAKSRPKRNDALWVAETLGIRLHIIDVIEEYKSVLTNPQHGFGSTLNPCLDCKIFMVKKAFEWMQNHEFDFIITGEVIGQRPNSQLKKKLPIVANHSGAGDRLLRPLSAKHLSPTLPERENWVDRNRLLDITGRGRKIQMEMAASYGYTDYAQPAGGCCVLTDEAYSRKLADLWEFRGSKNYDLDDIILLKIGRHLRPMEHFKMIISRDEGETNFLQGYKKRYTSLELVDAIGPIMLVDGDLTQEDYSFAAKVLARYAKQTSPSEITVRITSSEGSTKDLRVIPFTSDEISKQWYI